MPTYVHACVHACAHECVHVSVCVLCGNVCANACTRNNRARYKPLVSEDVAHKSIYKIVLTWTLGRSLRGWGGVQVRMVADRGGHHTVGGRWPAVTRK